MGPTRESRHSLAGAEDDVQIANDLFRRLCLGTTRRRRTNTTSTSSPKHHIPDRRGRRRPQHPARRPTWIREDHDVGRIAAGYPAGGGNNCL
jgi:hypothetical protein